MNLDFLQNVKLEAVVKTAPKQKVSTPKLPEEADIRLFKNGRVYPSEAFAKKHGLEFGPRLVVATEGKEDKLFTSGNGMDIFSSKDWGMIGALPVEVIFCAIVPKAAPKVDMWGSTKYEEDGSPKASVFTQGVNTFAKEHLTKMVTSAYGINWNLVEYVDLKVEESAPMVSPNGIYIVPKTISTGPKKGQPDYVRRENLNICPLVVESTFPSNPDEVAPTLEVVEEKVLATTDPGEDWASQLGKPAKAKV